MGTSEPTGSDIAAALVAAGIDGAPLRIEPRDGRIAVFLPGERLAWFPRSAEGREALAQEGRILRLIEQYCSFAAPRVLHADPTGWEVRSIVPGDSQPFAMMDRARADSALAARIGASVGRILADQHLHAPASELAQFIPRVKDWPRAMDSPNLPLVVTDPAMLARIQRAIARRDELVPDIIDPVLVHGDLGFHNIAFSPATGDVAGVFDYDGAVFGDRHQDFKLMLLRGARGAEPMLDAAIAEYQALTDQALDRGRILFFNAIEAIAFLAFRFGHAPEEEWCGRTLAEDLTWADEALTAVGF